MTEFASLRPLLDRLQTDLPIIQAPMAGTSSPALAATASNAGALGSIGVGATNAAGAQKMIADFRARSDRSLNVNVFCHEPARSDPAREATWIERLRPEFRRLNAQPPAQLTEIYQSFVADKQMLEMLLAVKPRVVSFHFGIPPAQSISALRSAGVVTLASATSLAEAQIAERGGVDAVVAQGYEAGGHRGMFDPDAADDRLGTLALTRLLVRRLAVPVIAAGGIMDGAGIAAVLQLGASAAQMGTAFIACPESDADAGFRAALASDAAHHTMITRVISGRPARCLANKFTAFGLGIEAADIPQYPIAYDVGKALNAAGKSAGEPGYGAQWAGQGAPLARSLPAAELIGTLVNEIRHARHFGPI
ncbi:MAG TPA: nitronate monooxygenase [Steroidobacteraceae bacterium]|nr:nitronate monooxygenase [Steroidobacteraceae bacterium]